MKIVFLAFCLFATAAYAQNLPWVLPPTNGVLVDQAVNAMWNENDGSLQIFATNVGGMTTTTLTSASAAFDPAIAVSDGNVDGISDTDNPPTFPDENSSHKFFALTAPPNGKQAWFFSPGYTLTAQVAYSFFDDTVWSGSLQLGGWGDAPGGGPYLHVVPEPSTWLLLAMALPMLLRRRR